MPPFQGVPKPDGRFAGVVLGVCALLTVIAISMHPVLRKVKPGEVITGMMHLGLMDKIIHGTLIVIMIAMLYAFSVYSLRRGLERQTVTGAMLSYALGIIAVIGAALIDGFIILGIASAYTGKTPEVMRLAIPVLQACSVAIQVLTKFGFIAMSAGILLWSSDLIGTKGFDRTAGIAGIVSALATIGIIAAGGSLNPHLLMVIAALQAIWYLCVASILYLRR